MALVVATRTVLPARYVPAFLWGNVLCAIQARRTPGHRTHMLALAPRTFVFWTLSVWSDGASMNTFRNSGAHARFMPRLRRWAREGATTAWQVPDDHVPTWDEAQIQIEKRAIFAELRRPAPRQLDEYIPPSVGPIVKAPFL